MHPLVIAAAGGMGVVALSKMLKKSSDHIPYDPATQNVARELQQGKTYAVHLMIDPRGAGWDGVTDPALASQKIAAAMIQSGWKVLSPPMPRNANAEKGLRAGQLSDWIFNGTWMMPGKYVTTVIPWVGMALPYLLPVA